MIGSEFPAVLRAAAAGDEHAFGRLWHDLQPRLLRYFAVVSPAVAEDLASETWLGVVRGIVRFEGNEPAFRAWVFTIARHEVLDWRRRAARRATEDLPANGLLEQAAPDDPAADALEGFATRAALAQVATLPPDRARLCSLDAHFLAHAVGRTPAAEPGPPYCAVRKGSDPARTSERNATNGPGAHSRRATPITCGSETGPAANGNLRTRSMTNPARSIAAGVSRPAWQPPASRGQIPQSSIRRMTAAARGRSEITCS